MNNLRKQSLKFDVVTIFPAMVKALLSEGVVGRASGHGVIDIEVHDLRSFTTDRHRTVDDVPYGGGSGMVMKPEPFVRALDKIHQTRGVPDEVVLTSPQGIEFSHSEAVRLSSLRHLVLLCGRYKGVDERVCEQVATKEISIGNYVLSGGEIPAAVILEAVGRLVPGVVGDIESISSDSFARSLLDCPHYTRPAVLGVNRVPDVLVSGNHSEIRRWRKREAIRRTMKRRPDLLAQATLDSEEQEVLRELQQLQ